MFAHHSWGEEFHGADTILAMMKGLPYGVKVDVEECFGEDDIKAIRFQVIIPMDAGNVIVRNEIAILRFEDGRLAEWWGAYDRLIEREQLNEE